jgi:hypothetical protein
MTKQARRKNIVSGFSRTILIDVLEIDKYDLFDWLDANEYVYNVLPNDTSSASMRNTTFVLVLFDPAAVTALHLKWGIS